MKCNQISAGDECNQFTAGDKMSSDYSRGDM